MHFMLPYIAFAPYMYILLLSIGSAYNLLCFTFIYYVLLDFKLLLLSLFILFMLCVMS